MKNDKKMELYNEFIDLTIPHSDMNNYFKREIGIILKDSKQCFENGIYKYGKRHELTPDSNKLADCVLWDLMETYQYLIPINQITDKEILWHWLSVFVGNNNIPNIRQHLTNEIYDNPEYKFDIYNSSSLFNETDYLIYSINIEGTNSIGTIKKTDFYQLERLSKELGYQLKDLK